jgi:hypothetical protein
MYTGHSHDDYGRIDGDIDKVKRLTKTKAPMLSIYKAKGMASECNETSEESGVLSLRTASPF